MMVRRGHLYAQARVTPVQYSTVQYAYISKDREESGYSHGPGGQRGVYIAKLGRYILYAAGKTQTLILGPRGRDCLYTCSYLATPVYM